MMTLEEILRPSQRKLFGQLRKLYRGSIAAVSSGKFLLVEGTSPILLVAHLDTVHQESIKTICKSHDGNILMSPEGIGGDDRCGVYALVKAYGISGKKPWLLFTCDEETGAGGTRAFVNEYMEGKVPRALNMIKYIVELDRKGRQDAVYYDCANADFEDYITCKGFITATGTFSDISLLAPTMGVAAVNLSSGYYAPHTKHEYINCKHLETVVGKIVEMIEEASWERVPRYEFVENVHGSYALHGMPRNYAELYDTLLEYYFPEELDECCEAYGYGILMTIYERTLGMPYRCGAGKQKRKGSDANGSGEVPQAASNDDSHNEPGGGRQSGTHSGAKQDPGTMAGDEAI